MLLVGDILFICYLLCVHLAWQLLLLIRTAVLNLHVLALLVPVVHTVACSFACAKAACVCIGCVKIYTSIA